MSVRYFEHFLSDATIDLHDDRCGVFTKEYLESRGVTEILKIYF